MYGAYYSRGPMVRNAWKSKSLACFFRPPDGRLIGRTDGWTDCVMMPATSIEVRLSQGVSQECFLETVPVDPEGEGDL